MAKSELFDPLEIMSALPPIADILEIPQNESAFDPNQTWARY